MTCFKSSGRWVGSRAPHLALLWLASGCGPQAGTRQIKLEVTNERDDRIQLDVSVSGGSDHSYSVPPKAARRFLHVGTETNLSYVSAEFRFGVKIFDADGVSIGALRRTYDTGDQGGQEIAKELPEGIAKIVCDTVKCRLNDMDLKPLTAPVEVANRQESRWEAACWSISGF